MWGPAEYTCPNCGQTGRVGKSEVSPFVDKHVTCCDVGWLKIDRRDGNITKARDI